MELGSPRKAWSRYLIELEEAGKAKSVEMLIGIKKERNVPHPKNQ